MAIPQHTGATAPAPIFSLTALSSSNSFDDPGALNSMLPFLSYAGGDLAACWHLPDLSAHQSPELAGREFGRRAAVAYAVSIGRHGADSLELASVVGAPAFFASLGDRSTKPGESEAAEAFCQQLMRLLWLLGQTVSPAQMAVDAEKAIERDRRDEWHVIEQAKQMLGEEAWNAQSMPA